MADIIEATQITRNEYGKGLLTRLFFDEEIEIGPEKNKSFSMTIDTCIVPGNEENPYEILVRDDKIGKLHSERCSKQDIIDMHFKVVNHYKEKYFKQHNLDK